MANRVIASAVMALCILFSNGPSGSAFAQRAIDLSEWTWSAPISTEVSQPDFVRVPLTPEVLDKSQRKLSDLRVVDAENRQMPYLIPVEYHRTERTWIDVTRINDVYEEGDYVRVTLAFDGRVPRNRLRVQLSGDSYRRFAALEGSDDQEQWALIDTTWLFRVRDGGEVYANDVWEFPLNDFPYLRLTVQNMEDEGGRIRIEQVEITKESEPEPPELLNVPLRNVAIEQLEDENITEIDMDLGYRNLPLDTLQLDVDDYYFHRSFELLGRNAETETLQRRAETGWEEVEREVPWQSVMRGVFYRVHEFEETEEHLAMTGLDAGYRYLRIRIHNHDNPPLAIGPTSVEVLRRKLPQIVFQAEPAIQYRLIFGNEGASAPRYDLARAHPDLETGDLPEAELGAINRMEPSEEARPWSERNRWLLWILLIVAVAAVYTVIRRNQRNIRPE